MFVYYFISFLISQFHSLSLCLQTLALAIENNTALKQNIISLGNKPLYHKKCKRKPHKNNI